MGTLWLVFLAVMGGAFAHAFVNHRQEKVLRQLQSMIEERGRILEEEARTNKSTGSKLARRQVSVNEASKLNEETLKTIEERRDLLNAVAARLDRERLEIDDRILEGMRMHLDSRGIRN